jgi:hypothetical protein
MEQVEITWVRALKIWWSWAWRAWVLSLLVMVPIEIIFGAFMISHMPKSGSNDPAQVIQLMAPMMILWPILMVAVVALQAQAMRWALNRAQWSDFRVAVVPRDA